MIRSQRQRGLGLAQCLAVGAKVGDREKASRSNRPASGSASTSTATATARLVNNRIVMTVRPVPASSTVMPISAWAANGTAITRVPMIERRMSARSA